MATSSATLLNNKYDYGQTPLIMACDALNVDLVKALLNDNVDVNATDDFNTTALIATIKSFCGNRFAEPRKLEIVKLLLGAGADQSLVGNKGQSALICAADKGYREIVRVLVDDDPDAAAQLIPDDYGGDFYDRLSEKDKEWFDKQFPEIANKKQFRQELDDLCAFIIAGAKPTLFELLNADYGNCQTLLIKACIANNFERDKELIEAGDNVDHQDKDGNTALIHAAQHENLDLIKILIAAKAGVFKKNLEEKDFYDYLTVQGIKDWVLANIQDFEKDRQMWSDAEIFDI